LGKTAISAASAEESAEVDVSCPLLREVVDSWASLTLGDRVEIAAIARGGNALSQPEEGAAAAAGRCGGAGVHAGDRCGGGDSDADGVAGGDIEELSSDLLASPQPGEVKQLPAPRGHEGIEYWACPMCLRKLPALGMVFCSTWCMSEWEEQTTAPVLQVIPPLKILTDLHSLYWQQAIENAGNQGE